MGSLGRGRQMSLAVVDDGYFWRFRWLREPTSSKTSEIRQAVLHDDMLPLVDWQMIAKWMNLNDLERLFDVKIRFRPALLESEHLNVRNSTTSAILRCSVHHDQLASLDRHTRS